MGSDIIKSASKRYLGPVETALVGWQTIREASWEMTAVFGQLQLAYSASLGILSLICVEL